MEKLINLLTYIKNRYPKQVIDTQCINELHDIYIKENLRHSYAELSRFCETLFPDERDIIIEKLDIILNALDNNDYNFEPEEKTKLKNQIGKLVDHLELESLRITRLESIKHIESKIVKDRNETEELANKSKQDMKSLNDEIKNINSQIVSVIGIFTGIVITIFGSMSLFSSIFSNINTVSGFKLTVISLIIGFLTFNIIAFMFIAISHLIGKPIILVDKASPLSDYMKRAFWFVNIVCIAFIITVSFLWIFF